MTTHRDPGDQPRRTIWLWIGAVAIVALPAVIGFALIGGDSGDDGNSMDGGMGAAPGNSGATAQLRDFSEILVDDATFVFDPAGESGELRLTTSIDVVCAVAYGPTTDLGSLSTDTDMAGGGHSSHHPILRGLAPGTEYFYRLQGIAADGALYVSEVQTFRVPEGDDEPLQDPIGENLAAVATISDVSSEFSASFAATNAIDQSTAREWSSDGDGDDAYITLDLGRVSEVNGVAFRTRSMSDGTSIITSFTITVDGETTYGPFVAERGRTVVFVEFTGRTIRFDAETTTGGNTGAVEIEVFGEPLDGHPDTQTTTAVPDSTTSPPPTLDPDM